MSSEEQELAEIMEENITFGQLATFLHNMMGLGLSEQFTRRFLDKMGCDRKHHQRSVNIYIMLTKNSQFSSITGGGGSPNDRLIFADINIKAPLYYL